MFPPKVSSSGLGEVHRPGSAQWLGCIGKCRRPLAAKGRQALGQEADSTAGL